MATLVSVCATGRKNLVFFSYCYIVCERYSVVFTVIYFYFGR
jgi:hypothetical protein